MISIVLCIKYKISSSTYQVKSFVWLNSMPQCSEVNFWLDKPILTEWQNLMLKQSRQDRLLQKELHEGWIFSYYME